MANVTISRVSASQYIGSPMVYRVTPTSAGASYTFYRAKLIVYASISGGSFSEFQFTTPFPTTSIDGTLTAGAVDFDVSSALRAVADRWTPQANVFSYPAITFYMEACEEWMIDGVIYENRNGSRFPSGSSTLTAYIGALTDRERLLPPESWPSYYSRKPTSSPEIVFVADANLNHLSAGPTSSAPSVTSVTTVLGTNGNTYGIAMPADGYELRFINSLGVHENVFVRCLRQTEVTIMTDKYVIARQETISQFIRGIAIKQNDREQWKMTAGPLDRQWQQWYLHEFLCARWAWINVDGNYLPVNILSEETVKGIDRTKPDALTVDFTIEFDINGSPFA